MLNLEDTPVTAEVMAAQLRDWPVSGLEEVIVVKGGDIVQVWP